MPGSGRPTNRRRKAATEAQLQHCVAIVGTEGNRVLRLRPLLPRSHDARFAERFPSRISTGVTPDQMEFRVLRSAADALPIGEMSAQARALGISPARINVTAANAGRGHVLVTCSTEVAIFLVEQFRELVAKAGTQGDAQLLIDASMAVAAIFKAIEAAHRQESPDD